MKQNKLIRTISIILAVILIFPFNIITLSESTDDAKPTLEHRRVTKAKFGLTIEFTVKAWDDIAVETVKLFYRGDGELDWNILTLDNTEDENYFGTIPAAEVSKAGMEYYIEVSDGNSIARDGSAQSPIKIAVSSSPEIHSVTPITVDVSSGDIAVITGINFIEYMCLFVGGVETESDFISSSEIEFVVPVGNLGKVDISLKYDIDDVENRTSLANALTYIDEDIEIQLSGGEVKAKHEVKLPVFATGESDIFGADLTFCFNESLFSSYTFETADDVMPEYNYYNNKFLVSFASSEPLAKGEPLGYLVLTPWDINSITAVTISLEKAALNGVSINKLIDSNLTIYPNFSISGNVKYYDGDIPIDGVKIKLSSGETALTDEDGNFLFEGITTGDIDINAELSSMVNGAISAQDAALVLQSIVHLTELNDMQALAADVNGDGVINALDASYILQKAVGIIGGEYPGSLAEWIFVPTFESLDLDSDLENINFTAILLGDVTGNWQIAEFEDIS